MNYFSYLLLIISLSGSLAFAAPCKEKLSVGVSLPLSAGPVSSGKAVMQGMQLAKEKFDQNDCINFTFEDDQLQPKLTVTNVNKLVFNDKVNALVVYGTPTSLAVTDIAEKSHIPMIALSILDKVVDGRSYILKHWCSARELSKTVNTQVERKRYKKISVISTINDAMLGLRDEFRKSNLELIISDTEVLKDDFDFGTYAQKILLDNPDAVYVLLYPPQTAPFIKKLRQLGYQGEMFGVHNFEDPAEVKAAGGSMEGLWFVNGDDSAGDNFKNDYVQKFKEIPAMGAASGYDIAKMMAQSLNSSLTLNQYLHKVSDFEGAFGTYSATKFNDFNFPARVKIIKDGGFTVLPD